MCSPQARAVTLEVRSELASVAFSKQDARRVCLVLKVSAEVTDEDVLLWMNFFLILFAYVLISKTISSLLHRDGVHCRVSLVAESLEVELCFLAQDLFELGLRSRVLGSKYRTAVLIGKN